MCKVSIIVIAYNIEGYIEKCLNSVIKQTYNEIEIIVVNDGSTDSTLDKIIAFSIIDNRIKIINKKNSGAMEARKSGLDIAKGEYILFVDGDDWIHKETIELLYNRAKDTDADIVLYNYFVTYNDRHKTQRAYAKDLEKLDDNLKNAILCHISPNLVTKFIKKEFIFSYNIKFPSNVRYAEDLATNINLFIHNPKISLLENNLYYYYQREDSVTKSLDERILDIPKAVEFIKESLIKKELYQKYIEEFNYLAYTHIFYNKIICTSSYEEIHKKMNSAWKEQKININKNNYYASLKKRSPIGLRLKMALFNYNYSIGLLYLNIRSLVGIRS
ncbi:glycosyltransferase family 2 protein [Alkalihalobacillus sp. MEB130]|uniref:glycosyltransferase family 2 protein n=1 Tax=Alkalihalobacillus sp. MEB130 TaxID=2976704 RepID=UPI0028DDB93C|nr:glycosyltransferase family 2 protein [Alkalihalobacillus sp. MEB130]MDT8861090.1 glycosyltransferase family 2 protein [Alkalihalobacillus sp. MEB130]